MIKVGLKGEKLTDEDRACTKALYKFCFSLGKLFLYPLDSSILIPFANGNSGSIGQSRKIIGYNLSPSIKFQGMKLVS